MISQRSEQSNGCFMSREGKYVVEYVNILIGIAFRVTHCHSCCRLLLTWAYTSFAMRCSYTLVNYVEDINSEFQLRDQLSTEGYRKLGGPITHNEHHIEFIICVLTCRLLNKKLEAGDEMRHAQRMQIHIDLNGISCQALLRCAGLQSIDEGNMFQQWF